ncbi:MAG: hypothetical protein EOP73_11790, partial [Variovorax sp.]
MAHEHRPIDPEWTAQARAGRDAIRRRGRSAPWSSSTTGKKRGERRPSAPTRIGWPTCWASRSRRSSRFPDGSIVIVEPAMAAEPGDCVVALDESNETTFKQPGEDGGRPRATTSAGSTAARWPGESGLRRPKRQCRATRVGDRRAVVAADAGPGDGRPGHHIDDHIAVVGPPPLGRDGRGPACPLGRCWG